MGGAERQQREFVRLGRPGSAATALVVFGVFYLVRPSEDVAWLLALLGVALALSVLSVVALRRFPLGAVARVSLAADIALLAVIIWVVGEPALLVLPYFAPVAFAALMFGPFETAVYTGLGAIAGVAVGVLIANAFTIVASVLVLVITGVIVSAMSREVRAAEAAERANVERLEELNELRERLVANVSHELRTPLTSVIGFLRTLERRDLDLAADERRRLLHIAREEAERLAVLVEDLLTLSRSERDALTLTLEPVRVADVVERATRGLDFSKRELVVAVPAGVRVVGDFSRLLQVLSNLLANALRHGGGRVTVDARPAAVDGAVAISVSDEGSGVAAARELELFVPFARIGARGEGAGLGLAIARAIAEAHGGSLEYRAPQNGRPHAFVLTLPRA